MTKLISALALVACIPAAHAATHVHVLNQFRKPSSPAAEPCLADKERARAAAADAYADAELDSDHHKISVTKNDFDAGSVYTSQANDAAVISFAAKVKHPSDSKQQLFLRVEALCSPQSGKYELMSTSWESIPKL